MYRLGVTIIRMGNDISRYSCGNLKDLPSDIFESIVSETYTVQRNPITQDGPRPGETGAREEEGWIILREPECVSRWEEAHVIFQSDKWKFFMTNGKSMSETGRLYGWRKWRTFWPTRLTKWEEREEWFTWLLTHVKTLRTPNGNALDYIPEDKEPTATDKEPTATDKEPTATDKEPTATDKI
jgi:hypothetical protein